MVDSTVDLDMRIRLAAFGFLARLRGTFGTEMPRSTLEQGFDFDGVRVPLMGPQGIWKPAVLPQMPLSITTVPPTSRKDAPYDDKLGLDGVLSYRYRGTDPFHRDNVGLRLSLQQQRPLVYFYGTVEGWYEAIWPAYVAGDDPSHLTFTLLVDQQGRNPKPGDETDPVIVDLRRYVTREVQQRLHQRLFRGRVIQAYANQCAVCRLRHRELLEAAHILADTDPRGQPVVPNGLSMCSLHHTAYDMNVIAVDPDYVIHIRKDVLGESDGPMLQHGLQGFQGRSLILPRRLDERPNREFLEERFGLFRRAS